ncbi:MAG: hypothetical protein AAGH57_06550 [Pseudomonadota bacterium]
MSSQPDQSGEEEIAQQRQVAQSERPVIVATSPGDGSVVSAGPIELGITFDRPMLNQYAVFPVRKEAGDYLGCIGSGGIAQSADKRSFTMRCEAIAGAEHQIRFGSEQGYFKDAQWRRAVPFVLSFAVEPESRSKP